MSSATTGDTMGGRYTLTDRIAAGGMGEVWQARDDILGRIVALKLLKAGLTDETGFTERFRNEARHSAALTHGNIAQVYDYGEDDGTAYLVMEYVPGKPLSKIIEQNAPMTSIDTIDFISQAAAALQAAHKNGLIHRDVKPANILIDPEGTAKLTDFGIARAVGSVAMTKTGEVMGTAQYLAPEAAMGRPSTNLSDVYALGVVAYEMLAGRRPFVADTAVALALAHVNEPPPPLPPFVPPTVRAVVHAALEKDPARRPQSAAEFGRALRQALRDADRMGALGPVPGPNRQGGPGHPSGPQRTGAVPAGRSGPQPSGPQQSGPQSGPNRVGPPSGPNVVSSGPQTTQTRVPMPGRSGANQQRPPQSYQQGPGPQGLQGHGQSGSGSRPASTSGPHGTDQVKRAAYSTEPGSNVEPATRRNLAASQSSGSGSSSGSSKKVPLIIAGAVAAVAAIVLAIVLLNSGGDKKPGETPPANDNPSNVNTGPFKTPFVPVSMPQSGAGNPKEMQ